jgi:hypothetical protein
MQFGDDYCTADETASVTERSNLEMAQDPTQKNLFSWNKDTRGPLDKTHSKSCRLHEKIRHIYPLYDYFIKLVTKLP